MKLKQQSSALVKEDKGVMIGFSKGFNYEVTIRSDVKMSTAQLTEEEMLKLAFWIKKKTQKNDLHHLIFDVDHLFEFIGVCTEKSKEVGRLQSIVEHNAERMETLRDVIKEQNEFIGALAIKMTSVCEMVSNGAKLDLGVFENFARIAAKSEYLHKKHSSELD